MKFTIAYVAGFVSSLLIGIGIIENKVFNYVLEGAVTLVGAFLCHKHHKNKKSQFWDGYRKGKLKL